MKAIFFDFDGVILDTAKLKADGYVSLYPGLPKDLLLQIQRYCEIHGGIPRHEKLKFIETQILRQPVTQERMSELSEAFQRAILHQALAAPFIRGAYEFLTRNFGKFIFFIVSGSPENELKMICQNRAISHLFAGIAGSLSRKADAIRELMSVHGLLPADSVLVGDSITDWHAAKDAGLRFIGVGDVIARVLPLEAEIIPDLFSLTERLST